MLKIIDGIKWIIKLPVFWMPASWKGYRRTIITAILGLCVAIQGMNLVDVADTICSVWTSISGSVDCNYKGLALSIVTYAGLLYEALKSEAETSIFDVLKGGKA